MKGFQSIQYFLRMKFLVLLKLDFLVAPVIPLKLFLYSTTIVVDIMI